MGSIPAGLNLYSSSHAKHYKDLAVKKNHSFKKSVTYTFYSLFSPSSVRNLGLYFNNTVNTNLSSNTEANFRNKKILIKQSYLLLAWLNLANNRNKKNCGFSFLPSKVSKFTMTKSPMAHKTFSQEQFIVQYRRLSVSLTLTNNQNLNLISTIMNINNFHLNKLSVGTNLIFLSKVVYNISSSDSKYFIL